MAWQRVVYRKSDLKVHYIDNYTSEYPSGPGSKNDKFVEQLCGFNEGELYGSFIAAYDYSTAPSAYYPDFWTGDHIYTCDPTARILIQGDVASVDSHHYGIIRHHNTGESPSGKAENDGFIWEMIQYPASSDASTISGWYGTGSPMNRAWWGGSGSEASGIAEFYEGSTTMAVVIDNNEYYFATKLLQYNKK